MATYKSTFLTKKISQILIGTLFLSSVSFAELIPDCQDIKYIESQATKIILGEVIDIQTQKGEGAFIYTLIKIKVDQYLRGEGPQSVIIKQFGGTIEENEQIIQVGDADSPKFKIGESGYFYLDQPDMPFYAGQFYSTVCLSGVMASASEIPPKKK